MSNYDYTLKILVLGARSTNKISLVTRYLYGFPSDHNMSIIGIDFFVKTINVKDHQIKLVIWIYEGAERFRFLLPQYCKGSNGAMFLYDITNPSTLTNFPECIRVIREQVGDIPIMFVGTKFHLAEEYRVITREEGIKIAEWYNLASFVEVSSRDGINIDNSFEVMTELMIENCTRGKASYNPPTREGQNPLTKALQKEPSITPPELAPKPPEFKINEKLILRLENSQTNIYVNGRLFTQCKYLLLNIPKTKFKECDEIDSIDEAAETLDNSLEGNYSTYTIPPQVEFWGHCSNLQAWYEHKYDSRLLHRNIAFPLLRTLASADDALAKKVFKEEIAKRFETGYPSVVFYLIENKFLNELTKQELDTIIESPKFIDNLEGWCFNKNVPEWLFQKIRKKLNDMNCQAMHSGNLSLKEICNKLNLYHIERWINRE
ncbi:MAG: hypothetical protein ACFFCI_00290 [Promethearchaeota archaeon]